MWLNNYDKGVPHTLEPYPDITLLDVITVIDDMYTTGDAGLL